jgi:hypothetical protein
VVKKVSSNLAKKEQYREWAIGPVASRLAVSTAALVRFPKSTRVSPGHALIFEIWTPGVSPRELIISKRGKNMLLLRNLCGARARGKKKILSYHEMCYHIFE